MSHNLLRILDANANRAREGLRVMEEACRFLLDDAALTRDAKTLRHDLAAALALLPELELHPDTPHDVGTTFTAGDEMVRLTASDVVIASGKRLSESFRALEEYSKLISPMAAARIEQLRYRGYELERRLHVAMGAGRQRQWRLCVLITDAHCGGRPWHAVAQAAMRGGADCVQLREKDLDAGELLARARQLVALAQPFRASVIINDRPDVAMLAGADGVHVGQHDLPCDQVRKLVGRRLLVGVSTSNLEEANLARAQGADYCGVGPMFPTTTKHKPLLAGPTYLAAYVAQPHALPHLAIGGIDTSNVSQLAAVGCMGVAVTAAVCAAPDPEQAARALVNALPMSPAADVRPQDFFRSPRLCRGIDVPNWDSSDRKRTRPGF